MKTIPCLLAVLLASLTACSTTGKKNDAAKDKPETVLVTYHCRQGKEVELEDALTRIWEVYQKEHLVFAQPHVVVRDKENGNLTRYGEILTWVNHSAPDHASEAVKKIWQEEQALCEPRGGRTGIEGGEVELVVPPGN